MEIEVLLRLGEGAYDGCYRDEGMVFLCSKSSDSIMRV